MSNVSLKQMAEGKTPGIQKATIFKIHPSVVKFEPGFNLRDEGPDLEAHVERIYLAMKAGAYIPPIDVSVVDGEVIARDGHCRTRAALRLCGEGTEYLLEARQLRGNDADATFHMLGSDQGLKFSPLAQGRGYLRLINMGKTIPEIAERLGVSRTTIENGLALAETPAAVQKLVSEGKVSASLALSTVRAEGTKAAATKLTEAVKAAEATGKAKATAKHVEGSKTPKLDQKAVRELLQQVACLSQPFSTSKIESLARAARQLIGN